MCIATKPFERWTLKQRTGTTFWLESRSQRVIYPLFFSSLILEMSLILNIIYLQNPKINDFRKTTRFYHVVSQEAIKPSISVRMSDSMKKIIADVCLSAFSVISRQEKKLKRSVRKRKRSELNTWSLVLALNTQQQPSQPASPPPPSRLYDCSSPS